MRSYEKGIHEGMKVLIFCAKGFETMELSPFVDILGWTREDVKVADISFDTCGFTKQVTSTFGVTITVDHLISEVKSADYDALAIPGGFEEYGFYEEAFDERLSALIREFHVQNKPIASICVGALALGKSGILQGKRATTYHLSDGHRQQQLAAFGANVVNEPVVVDGNVITSWCPQTAPYVGFALLEKLIGTEKTNEVKYAMGFAEG